MVNALWEGGAQGIQVMDQRLISTSAVRCVGNTLILQGRVYSPPYKITAVGDQDDAAARRSTPTPAIQNYLQYVEAYGLGWEVEEHELVDPARLLRHRRPALRQACGPARGTAATEARRRCHTSRARRAARLVRRTHACPALARERGRKAAACTAGSGGICRATRGCGR